MSTQVSTQEFRRVHRLTPLLQLWTAIVAVIVLIVANMDSEVFVLASNAIHDGFAFMPLLVGLFALAVFFFVVWLVSGWWWKAIGYRLGEEQITLRTGVIHKQERTARYDRIEAVDVVRSVIARLFHVAAVRVETAAGTVKIEYLSLEEAPRVREEILRRVSGEIRSTEEATTETVVDTVQLKRILVSNLLSGSLWVGVGSIVVAALIPGGLVVAIPVLIGVIPALWNIIDGAWKYTATRGDDNTLDVTYGLADLRRQTIPVQRIHAVSVTQPLLWRIPKWWRVDVSIAGYGLAVGGDHATTTLLPVGTWDEVERLLDVIGPAPAHTLLTEPDFESPHRAWWVSPLDVHQQSTSLVGDIAVTRRGRFSTVANMINISHIQELTYHRGPIQNLLGLCSVEFDLIDGPVSMRGRDLDPMEGKELLNRLRKRSLPALTQKNP